MNIITIGIDLAKNIFAVHGVNESGKAIESMGSDSIDPVKYQSSLTPLIFDFVLLSME